MKNTVLVIVSIVLAPCWALAQNGVVLINQSTVAASGANRSTGGFPYVIAQPGSYQLSGNLTVPANVNGIVISASSVSLDLNGFIISSVGSSTGYGIFDNALRQSGISIRNGTVLGFLNGIYLFASIGNLIEKVTAQSNGNGIVVGNSSTIKDCIALDNREDGIFTTLHGIVSGSVASGNGSRGIVVRTGTLTANTADNNSGRGIHVSDGNSTLTGNTASNNGGDGFSVFPNSTITGNTASNNSGNGFSVRAGSTIMGNTASANNIGFVVSCPVNLVGNTAGGNTSFSLDEDLTGGSCNRVNNLFF